MTHQIDRNAQAALVRAAASFVRDTYSGEWADDAAATLETDADLIERGEPCSLLRLAEAMQPAAVSAVVEPPADQTTPSHRAALRDHIAGVLWPLTDWDGDELNAERAADAVLAVLYREWPWLRAEAEDAAPPADRATVLAVQVWMALDLHQALGRPVDHSATVDHQGHASWADWWADLLAGVRTAQMIRDYRAPLRRMADETATTQTQPTSTAPLAAGLPLVKGNCPACGSSSLFLGNGGYVTCSRLDCPEPDAASTTLEQPAAGARQDGAAQ